MTLCVGFASSGNRYAGTTGVTFLVSGLVVLAAAILYFGVLWAERGRIADGPSWIRCRAAQVAQYLHLRRYLSDMSIVAQGLLQDWQQLREGIVMGCWQLFRPKYWLNALCPCKRVRRMIRRITGIRLSTSGYHESTVQELAWNRGLLIMLSAAAAIPLFGGWWYQRYQNPSRAFLVDSQPRLFNYSAAYSASSQMWTFDGYWNWLDLSSARWEDPPHGVEIRVKVQSLYESSWPVVGDDPMVKYDESAPLDLSLCPAEDGSTSGMVWAGVKYMDQYNYSMDAQLLCYCGYILICMLLIWLESEENMQLAVSCKLNAVYDPEQSSNRPFRIRQFVVIIVLVILSIIFVYTLSINNPDEAFLVFASTGFQVAGQSIRYASAAGKYIKTQLAKSTEGDAELFFLLELPPHPGSELVGMSCSGLLPPGTAVLLIYQDKMSAEDLGFATFQGILFLGGLISLYWAHSRMYDFINLDQYLRTLSAQRRADDEEGKESMSDSVMDCPYAAFLRNIHEQPRRIGRREVTQYLYEEVDLPFLRVVEQKMPGLFYEIMNDYEADEVMRHVQGRAEVMVEQKWKRGMVVMPLSTLSLSMGVDASDKGW